MSAASGRMSSANTTRAIGVRSSGSVAGRRPASARRRAAAPAAPRRRTLPRSAHRCVVGREQHLRGADVPRAVTAELDGGELVGRVERDAVDHRPARHVRVARPLDSRHRGVRVARRRRPRRQARSATRAVDRRSRPSSGSTSIERDGAGGERARLVGGEHGDPGQRLDRLQLLHEHLLAAEPDHRHRLGHARAAARGPAARGPRRRRPTPTQRVAPRLVLADPLAEEQQHARPARSSHVTTLQDAVDATGQLGLRRAGTAWPRPSGGRRRRRRRPPWPGRPAAGHDEAARHHARHPAALSTASDSPVSSDSSTDSPSGGEHLAVDGDLVAGASSNTSSSTTSVAGEL